MAGLPERSPIAVHTEVVGQESPETPSSPDGTDWLCHVLPPFVVPTTTGADCVGVSPSTSQTEVDAHETAEMFPTPAGKLWVIQLAPPLVE
jgi:hypothetical protein